MRGGAIFRPWPHTVCQWQWGDGYVEKQYYQVWGKARSE